MRPSANIFLLFIFLTVFFSCRNAKPIKNPDIEKKIAAGDSLFQLKQFDKARNSYQDALVLDTTCFKCDTQIKACKDSIDSISKPQLDTLVKIREFKKDVAEGDSLFASKKYERAIKSYTAAHKIADTCNTCLTQIDKCKTAIKEYNKPAPPVPDDHAVKADLLFRQGKYVEAAAQYKKALAADKNNCGNCGAQINRCVDRIVAEANKLFNARNFIAALGKYKVANGINGNCDACELGIKKCNDRLSILKPKNKTQPEEEGDYHTVTPVNHQ